MSTNSLVEARLVSSSIGILRATGTLAVALLSSVLLLIPAALAQETSAQITGRIVDPAGGAVSGAEVTITHVPSGTVATAKTNQAGRFSAAGLRVGGPFNVTIAKSGFEDAKFDDVFTQLGQSVAIDAQLESTALAEVVVEGTRQQELALGVASRFSNRDINSLPSVSRDIKDVIRLDPKVKIDATNSDAIEIAGSSPRFNSITVDGIRQSDDFGLNNNGYPTQRAPISLDAIEAVSVQTAPYDVQYGNFQGGTINVVTKSGTNKFHGSAYYYKFDDNFVGDRSRDRDLAFTFEEKTWGASFGGPIFKDRLFFFLSYEKLDRSAPVETGPTGAGFPVSVMGVTQAEFDQVAQLAQSVYNFDVGQLAAALPEGDEKILGRFDWNISDSHKAQLSLQRSEGNEIIQTNSSASQNRVSAPSNWYNRGFELQQVSVVVNSEWTDTFSTEFKIGRKEVVGFQNSLNGTDFAEMQILTPTGGTLFIGPDQFRHANSVTNDLDQLKLQGKWLLGNHTVSVGYELERLDVFNLFVQNSEGQYFFDCITPTPTCTNAFSTRSARELRYNNAVTNNKLDGAAKFSYDLQTIYVQDKWEITPRLTVQAGLRYERYSSGDKPTLNTNFATRNGFANTTTFDGLDLLLPRIGFNFQVNDDTSVYGGVGMFGGGTPNVWLSNSFSNDGVTIVETRINRTNPNLALRAAALDGVDGFTIPTLVQQQLVPGNGSVNALDPDFNIPSSWRFSLGVDRRMNLGWLGDNYKVKAEAIYTRVKDAVYWRDLRLFQSGTAPLTDGRPRYSSTNASLNDIVLTNTREGESALFSLDVSKTWRTAAGRFDLFVGYAYNDSLDVNPGTSSTAFSSFGRVGTSDPNNPLLATSNYETRHRFPLSISWRKAFFGDNETSAALFVERRSGRPYSLTFGAGTSAFGDPSQSAERRQLLYLPVNSTDIDFGSTTTGGVTRTLTAAQFDQFISDFGLEKYRGRIIPRNAFRSPWVTSADLRLSQQIPTFIKNSKAILTLDIENVANLINSDWGRLAQISFPHFAPALDATIQANGRYQYRPLAGVTGVSPPLQSLSAIQSVWRMQLGLRIEF